jgi:hypothetical protein
MRYRTPGLVLLCAVVAACGGDDDGGEDGTGADASSADASAGGGDSGAGSDAGSRGDAGAGPYARHIIAPWCAPNDGPAVRISLGDADAQDSCAIDELAPHVLLDVWTQEIEAPVTYSFAPTEASGSGAFCPGGTAPCRSFSTGDIHFDAYAAGESGVGTWRLLGDEEMMTGDFNATWCEPANPPPCG